MDEMSKDGYTHIVKLVLMEKRYKKMNEYPFQIL